jgi:hypothetical protein
MATRLLMVKADGSLLIHADSGGYRPLNWMLAPAHITEEPGRWVVTNRGGESLTITITAVHADVTYDLGPEPGLEKDGVEAQLQELLAARPEVLEEGLRLIRREHPTDLGPVDLLCRDEDGRAVAVEVKRVGEIAGVDQVLRYCERLDLDPRLRPVRGILAAAVVKPQAAIYASSRGIAVVTVDELALRELGTGVLTLF